MKKSVIFIIAVVLIAAGITGGFLSRLGSRSIQREHDPNDLVSVTLYFPGTERQLLIGEKRNIIINKNEFADIIEQLAFGPVSIKSRRVFRKESHLKEAFMEGNIVYLNFSKGLITEIKKDKSKNPNLIIYSIVNSILHNVPAKRVQILVEGKKLLLQPNNYDYFNPLPWNNRIISHLEDEEINRD